MPTYPAVARLGPTQRAALLQVLLSPEPLVWKLLSGDTPPPDPVSPTPERVRDALEARSVGLTYWLSAMEPRDIAPELLRSVELFCQMRNFGEAAATRILLGLCLAETPHFAVPCLNAARDEVEPSCSLYPYGERTRVLCLARLGRLKAAREERSGLSQAPLDDHIRWLDLRIASALGEPSAEGLEKLVLGYLAASRPHEATLAAYDFAVACVSSGTTYADRLGRLVPKFEEQIPSTGSNADLLYALNHLVTCGAAGAPLHEAARPLQAVTSSLLRYPLDLILQFRGRRRRRLAQPESDVQ